MMLENLISFYHSLCRDMHNPGVIKLTVEKKLFTALYAEVAPKCRLYYEGEPHKGDPLSNACMFKIHCGIGHIEIWKEKSQPFDCEEIEKAFNALNEHTSKVSEGLKSGIALLEDLKDKPLTPAERVEIIQQLLYPNTIDEDGNVIHLEPLITKEQALKLLDF